MNEAFPSPITNEADLDFYENYLQQEFKKPRHETLMQRLEAFVGCRLKTEYSIGNRSEIKIGKLLEIGQDFILIAQAPNGQKTLVLSDSINAVTILGNTAKNQYL